MALARALAPRPRIMLMDEPFSGLDNRLRDGIRDETLALLKEEGTTVLLVTHEPEEAMRMADEIALMRDGRIVQRGAPYNVYNAPADKEAVAFFSDVNVLHGVVQGALVNTPFGQFLAPGHVRRHAPSRSCSARSMSASTSTGRARPEPDAMAGHAGARRGGTGAVHGVGKPCRVPHGS